MVILPVVVTFLVRGESFLALWCFSPGERRVVVQRLERLRRLYAWHSETAVRDVTS